MREEPDPDYVPQIVHPNLRPFPVEVEPFRPDSGSWVDASKSGRRRGPCNLTTRILYVTRRAVLEGLAQPGLTPERRTGLEGFLRRLGRMGMT